MNTSLEIFCRRSFNIRWLLDIIQTSGACMTSDSPSSFTGYFPLHGVIDVGQVLYPNALGHDDGRDESIPVEGPCLLLRSMTWSHTRTLSFLPIKVVPMTLLTHSQVRPILLSRAQSVPISRVASLLCDSDRAKKLALGRSTHNPKIVPHWLESYTSNCLELRQCLRLDKSQGRNCRNLHASLSWGLTYNLFGDKLDLCP